MEEQQAKYTERNEVYYKNLPAWPDFDIYNKNIDGLIPVASLESWEQFHELVKTYRADDRGAEYVFRGQHNYAWALQPSLDRMSPGAIEEGIARKQLRNFRLSIRGRVPDNAVFNEKEEELWAIGQHHGLATPLLDWSSAPYVALFFAFVSEDLETWADDKNASTNHSRIVYILNKLFIEDLVETKGVDPILEGYPRIVEPSKDDHGRLVNQAGLFTIAPYGETIESSLLKALVDSKIDVDDPIVLSKYICKIHIPNSSEIRRDCLRHLRKMNIHHGSLFPDIIGASGYCNELISEAIENRKKLTPTKPEEIDTSVTDARPLDVASKDFVINESDAVTRKLMLALIIDKSIKGKVAETKLEKVVQSALYFIKNKAGVDWYIRDSQRSRLKNIIRRQLKKIQFPEDFVSQASEALCHRTAEMSKSEEENKG